jgi:hypothetical protein
MQKSIGGAIKMNSLAGPDYMQSVDGSHRRVGLACSGPKGRKVMFTKQATGTRAHATDIERLMNPPRTLS